MINIAAPSFTRRLDSSEISSVGITHLIYGADIEEERAETIVEELSWVPRVQLCRVGAIDDALCHIHGLDTTLNIFEWAELEAFAQSIRGLVAIDLTSLEHRIWAPFVKALVSVGPEVVALYAEPNDYRRSEELPGVYDLSTTRGIRPLPGFAHLSRRSDDEGHLRPCWGSRERALGTYLIKRK